MKKATRGIWRTMSCSLAAAGSLGLAGATHAQSPYAPLPTPAVKSTNRPRPLSYEEQCNRATEIRTELAWLANAAVFPYHLEAHVVGSALEVRGSLPTEMLHAEALKVAREESGMPVLDGITIYPNLVIPPVSKPAQVLNGDIKSALARALPGRMEQERITVSVWMGGQVVLAGAVATLEDKLTASRCLQRAAGCSCVVNRLEAEQSIDKVSASKEARDGMKGAGGGSAAPQGSATAEQVKVLPPRAIQVDAQQPVPFLNTSEQGPAHEGDAQKALWSAAKQNPPLPQAVAVPIVGPRSAAGQEGENATTSGNAESTRPAEHVNSSPLMYHATKWRKPDSNAGAWTTTRAASQARMPGGSPGIILIADAEPEAPSAPAAPAHFIAPNTPVTEHKPAPPMTPEAQVSEGTIFFDDTEKTVLTETTKTLPAETTKRVPAKTASGTHALQKRLQQLIADACHKPLKDVEVMVVSATKLEVRVKTRYADECEALAKGIFQLPQLAAYQVSLEIPVAH